MTSWCTRGHGRYFILLVVALLVIATYEIAGAQPPPTILWNVTLDRSGLNDLARGVAVGPDGNPVVTGISGSDFSTVKYDGSTGAILWTATCLSGPNLGARAVAVGPDGNPVVTGTMGDGDGGPQDFLTIKYNGTTGVILWTAVFDALAVDQAMGVAIGPDGNPVVTGISCGPWFSSPKCDFQTVKYDGSDGTILWNVTYDSGSGGQDFARGVTVDPNGDVFVVGASNFVDVVTIKYRGTDGTTVWTVAYNHTSFGTGEEQGWGVAVGSDGHPVVTGNSRTGSNQNVRTVKLDGSTGTIWWNTIFGSAAGEEAKGVAVGPDGNPVVTGSVNPTGGDDDDNFLTIKYDGSTGAILWNVTFDTGGKDVGSGVAVGPDGSPVVTGLTRQSGSSFNFLTIKYLQQLTVSIDIKPGSDPNSVNLSSAGVIPVAILGSATFDATQVDPATVALAGASVKLIGKGTKYSCSTEDVNADGFVDLVCHVMTAQFMIEPGDSVAVLEAQTFDGLAIRGQDSIKVVPD